MWIAGGAEAWQVVFFIKYFLVIMLSSCLQHIKQTRQVSVMYPSVWMCILADMSANKIIVCCYDVLAEQMRNKLWPSLMWNKRGVHLFQELGNKPTIQ